MRELGRLVKRNCLVYFRDRSAVMGSLFTMLIVVVLMVAFLGKMSIDSIVNILDEFGHNRDAVADRANAELFIVLWTVAGIVIVNAVTVTQTMIGIMVQDDASGKLAGFYVAPVKRFTIVLGYVLSSVIVGILMCVFTMLVAEVYIVSIGGTVLGFVAAMKVLGIIVLNVFTSSCIMFILSLLMKTESGWNAVAMLVGTLVGFVGGIYIPVGSLPTAVVGLLKCFPVLHGSAMLRTVLTEDIMGTLFTGIPADVPGKVSEEMGIAFSMGGQQATPLLQVLFILGYGIIALLLATFIMRRKNVRDR